MSKFTHKFYSLLALVVLSYTAIPNSSAAIPVVHNADESELQEEAEKWQESKEKIQKKMDELLPVINTDEVLKPIVNSAKELELFERHLNRVFSNSIRSMMSYDYNQEIFSADADLEEYLNYYIVRIDLPGFDKNSFEIEINNNEMQISGSRESKKSTSDGVQSFYMSERHYGRFRRIISLPSNVDPDRSTAKYENGVLIINIPKNANFNDSGVKIRVK